MSVCPLSTFSAGLFEHAPAGKSSDGSRHFGPRLELGRDCWIARFKLMELAPKQYEIILAHFESVVLLAKHLKEAGTDIHEHEYDYHSFGTWKIVAGSYRHRFRFIWDGRKQVLTISESFFSVVSNWGDDWKELRTVEIGAERGADPIKYLEEFFSH
jgi:hypothetical protein